jgi:16S rRNA processing protein RimM
LHNDEKYIHIMSSELTSIGFISRAHGLTGEVVLEPFFDDAELYDINHLFYFGKEGSVVPARIEAFKLVRKGNQHSFFVKFEHITNRTEAEKAKGSSVFLSSELIPEESDSDDDLIGYRVVDEDGAEVGEVVDVVENPAHLLLQVRGDNGAFFIPYVEAYINSIDDKGRVIEVSDISELKTLNG